MDDSRCWLCAWDGLLLGIPAERPKYMRFSTQSDLGNAPLQYFASSHTSSSQPPPSGAPKETRRAPFLAVSPMEPQAPNSSQLGN
eukprot:scaffold472736_cov41-Prasinocladus_malaysianus.AAC.1